MAMRISLRLLQVWGVLVLGVINLRPARATFDLSRLPFIGTTTTISPIIIIQPPPPYGSQVHHGPIGPYNGQYGHFSGNYILVLENTEVPFINNNFLDDVQFQIQRISGTMAACVGTIRLKRQIQHATLAIRIYSCNQNQCNTCIQEHPRQPFCYYMNQHSPQCGGYTNRLGCALQQGTYSFSTYIPLNVLPQEIPGQRWRMDCYLAQSGKRIATFSLYSRCGPNNGNPYAGWLPNNGPNFNGNGGQGGNNGGLFGSLGGLFGNNGNNGNNGGLFGNNGNNGNNGGLFGNNGNNGNNGGLFGNNGGGVGGLFGNNGGQFGPNGGVPFGPTGPFPDNRPTGSNIPFIGNIPNLSNLLPNLLPGGQSRPNLPNIPNIPNVNGLPNLPNIPNIPNIGNLPIQPNFPNFQDDQPNPMFPLSKKK